MIGAFFPCQVGGFTLAAAAYWSCHRFLGSFNEDNISPFFFKSFNILLNRNPVNTTFYIPSICTLKL
jgi:hypothetical protein